MTKVQIFEESVDVDSFDDTKLPTDIHLVTFTTADGKTITDAVRAYTMVDIFDVYYDRVGKEGAIHSIQAGFGRIRPNLYGKIKSED